MDVKPGYKATEIGVIPEDWEVTTVGAEFTVQLGKMLDSERNTGELKPYLGNRAVQWNRIDVHDLPYVPMSKSDVEKFRLLAGDVLVCEGGEVGRAAIWDAPLEECYYQKALHRLRARRGYRAHLIVTILERHARSGILSNFVTQTSIAHLPRDKFLTVPIPRPSDIEQDAIVGALRDADVLLNSLDLLIAKKRDLKQAAMQQLLTGQTRLPGFHGEWEVKRLSELGVFIKGSGVRKDEARSGDLRCIRYGEIYTHHNDCIRAFHSWISPSVARSATRLQRGDVLFAGSGETKGEIGKCVAFVNDDEAYAGGDIVILRPRVGEPRFLGYLLNAPAVAAQKASLGQGDAVVHISASALGTVVIPFPEVDEQRAIAAVLSDMDDELSALEARRDKTRALKEAMMQELLTGRTRLV